LVAAESVQPATLYWHNEGTWTVAFGLKFLALGVVQPGMLYAHNDWTCTVAAAMKVLAVESAQPLTAYVQLPAELALLLKLSAVGDMQPATRAMHADEARELPGVADGR
jgi:hypothetical protein